MFDDKTEIQRWVEKLDQVARGYEAKWGIGNLTEYCSSEIKKKWDRQNEKLAQAIQMEDLGRVINLAQGTIRAWKVLEEEAEKGNHKPISPECMEVELPSGFKLRIAKNQTEARSVTEQGVRVWPLEQVARVIES